MQEVSENRKLSITYSFDDIDYINQYKQGIERQYERDLIKTMNKLMLLRFSHFNDLLEAYESFAIINAYKIYNEKGVGYIKIYVNDKAEKFIELMFSSDFKLNEYSKLSSSYSKRAFQLVEDVISKANYHEKSLDVSLDQFIEIFDVPTSYSQSDIDKNIISKITKELQNYYPSFSIKKIYGDTRGKPVVGFSFSWSDQK